MAAKWDISPAANWNQAIDDALYDCAKFLIVLSPASVKSIEVQGELVTALREKKPIVPLLFQECRIPRQLQLFQHIDFTSLEPDDSVALEQILSVLKVADSASAEPTKSKAKQVEERKRGEKAPSTGHGRNP